MIQIDRLKDRSIAILLLESELKHSLTPKVAAINLNELNVQFYWIQFASRLAKVIILLITYWIDAYNQMLNELKIILSHNDEKSNSEK